MLSNLHSRRLIQLVQRNLTMAAPKSVIGGHFEEYAQNRREYISKNKVYTHPLDSKHHPINFSPIRYTELLLDFMGPEPVSPHYEPFTIARRFAVTSLVSLGLMSYLMKISDLNFVLQSTFTGLFYYSIQYFIFFEGVKYLFL